MVTTPDTRPELCGQVERRFEWADDGAVEELAHGGEAGIAEAADDDRVRKLCAAAQRGDRRRDAGRLFGRALDAQRTARRVRDFDDRAARRPALQQSGAPLDFGGAEWTGAQIAGNLVEDARHQLVPSTCTATLPKHCRSRSMRRPS